MVGFSYTLTNAYLFIHRLKSCVVGLTSQFPTAMKLLCQNGSFVLVKESSSHKHSQWVQQYLIRIKLQIC